MIIEKEGDFKGPQILNEKNIITYIIKLEGKFVPNIFEKEKKTIKIIIYQWW